MAGAAPQVANLIAFARGERHHGILEQALRQRDEDRGYWHPLWQELAEFFYPDRKGFMSEQRPGNDRRDDIYGSVAELARRGLSTACSTMLRPAGRTWFKAKPKREDLQADESVRMWCDLVTRITYQALYDPRANFEKQCSECDGDVVTFGTGVVRPVWNARKRHLEFRTTPMNQVVLGCDASGSIDMAYTFWMLTLRQLMQMFPEERLPDSIKSKLQGQRPDLNEKIEVVHCCVPNEDYMRQGGRKSQFAYASLWIAVADKWLLDEGGYYEFPYVVPRWDTSTAEVYGRSPAMIALRDARLADAITRSIVEAAETALQPPMVSPMNTIRGQIDLRAGGITMYDPSALQGLPSSAQHPLMPVAMGEQPQKMLELLQVVEDRIGSAFFRDILELPQADSKELTATEINARLDQYLRQAAPVFSRLEATYNAGLVNRVFGILMREHEYPPPPPVLEGEEIEFEYESPIKAARDKAEAIKVFEHMSMVAQLAGSLPPEKAMDIMDNYDFDVATRYLALRSDIPQVIMTPIEKMIAAREARAKEMQMAKMAEMAKMAGPAISGGIASMAKAKEAGMIGDDQPWPITPSQAGQVLENVDFEEMAAA